MGWGGGGERHGGHGSAVGKGGTPGPKPGGQVTEPGIRGVTSFRGQELCPALSSRAGWTHVFLQGLTVSIQLGFCHNCPAADSTQRNRRNCVPVEERLWTLKCQLQTIFTRRAVNCYFSFFQPYENQSPSELAGSAEAGGKLGLA